MKSMRAAVALCAATAIALFFATACDSLTGKKAEDEAGTLAKAPAVMGDGSSIFLISSNLGDSLGSLINHSPTNVLSGDAPYLPVVRSELYNGITPFVTFTFNKDVKKVFASTYGTGTSYNSGDGYIFDITGNPGTATKKLLQDLPAISGQTVTFYLPPITPHSGGTNSDGNTFVVGNRYFADFFVQAGSEFGRVSVAFIVTNAKAPIGPFSDSDVSIFGKTTQGQQVYSLYRIDSERAFYLKQGQPATHTTAATEPEQVKIGTTVYTTFDTYASRYQNGAAKIGTVFESLDALAAAVGVDNERVTTDIQIDWNPVANALAYQIYTTDDPALSANWVYLDTVDPILDGTTYNFDIGTYTIDTYRAIRIIPVNNVEIGAAAHIRLIDEIRPITSRYDSQDPANDYTINTSKTNHRHDGALVEGEIVSTGTKNLGAGVIIQPDTNPEPYQITNITGNLVVTTQAPSGAILSLSVAQLLGSDNFSLPAGARTFQLGDNAVGVLTTTNILEVFVRVKCYLPSDGTITYSPADSFVTGNLNVTYADMSGNLMISRGAAPNLNSRNNGVIIFTEN